VSEPPRLLFCTFDVIPAPTGSSRRLTEYLKGLSERFNVVVLSAKTPDLSHIEKYQGARLLRVPVGSGDLASRLQAFDRAVRRQLESEEYALVHFTEPFGGYALCEQKDSYGYRLVYEANSFPSQELRFTHPQTEGDRRFISRLRRQELYCLMNAERVITASPVTRELIHRLGVPEEQVRLLPAPVDLTPYRPEALRPPDGAPMRVLYLGSQMGWQGLPTLLRGFAHALERADLRLALVGPSHPDWQPHLEDLVNELALQGKVDFQPPVAHDDLFKVVAACDLAVLPLEDNERNRTQGGALAKASEYLAAGRPVLAADLPVCRAALPDDGAVFFPPGNAEGLADRLVELAGSPSRRVEMGKKARAFGAEKVDAAKVRAALIDLYEGLIGAPRRAAPEESSHDKETSVALAPVELGPSGDTDPAAPHPESDGPPVVIGVALPAEAPEAATAPELSATPTLDPWLAQLVHGYCPPDALPFARPTPSTNFPGRDEPNRPPRTTPPRSRVTRGEDSSPGFKP
jgi:glycosyltransferase involved in cell wall biosynthesis